MKEKKLNIQIGDLWDGFLADMKGKKYPIEEQCYRVQIIAKATFRGEDVYIGKVVMYWLNGKKIIPSPFNTPSFLFISSDGIEKSFAEGHHIGRLTIFKKVGTQKGATYPLVETDPRGAIKCVGDILEIADTVKTDAQYRERIQKRLVKWLTDPC